jgi:uncharacterized protein YraI
MRLNLRAGPGINEPVVGDLPEGVTLVEVGATTSANGITWVKVRASSGQVGWVAKDYLLPASSGARG